MSRAEMGDGDLGDTWGHLREGLGVPQAALGQGEQCMLWAVGGGKAGGMWVRVPRSKTPQCHPVPPPVSPVCHRSPQVLPAGAA